MIPGILIVGVTTAIAGKKINDIHIYIYMSHVPINHFGALRRTYC